MSTQTVSVRPDALIHIEAVGGDIQVEGWDRSEVKASGSQLRLEQRADAVEIDCTGEVVLSMPRAARLELGRIGGDAHIQNLDGPVQVGVIGGDLNLQNLSGKVQMNGVVGGDTHMQNVSNISMTPGGEGRGYDMAQQVRRKIQRAARHAERTLQRAELHAYVAHSARWRSNAAATLESPAPEGAVTDEERLTVLRMLQDGKITSEQAEKLLAALEGNPV